MRTKWYTKNAYKHKQCSFENGALLLKNELHQLQLQLRKAASFQQNTYF